MRVVIRRSDIIKIGSNFVTSASHSEGIVPMVDMVVTFGVNIPALLKLGGTSLRISVYDQELYLGTRSFVAQLAGDSLTSSTITESQEKDRITRTRDELCLYKENVDVTKFIANETAKSTRADKKNIVEYVSILGSRRDDKGENISPEVPRSSSAQADEKFMRDLVNRGIDPATVSTKFPVLDVSKSRKKQGSSERENIPEEGAKKRMIQVYSLVGRPGVYRKSFVKTNYYTVIHTVQMPYSKVSQVSKLYFHLEALGKGEVSVDYEVVQFDTRQMVLDVDRYRANSQDISGMNGQQAVTNYTREIYPPRSSNLSFFLPYQGGMEQVTFYKFGYPIVIRSIASSLTSISTNFTGRVILRENPVTPSVQQGTNEIPFFINRNGDELQIKIAKVPENVITVQLQRREVIRKMGYTNLGEPRLVTTGDSITLVDRSMRDSTTYEYRLSFIDNRSNRRNSSNTILYHYISSALATACSLSIVSVTKSEVVVPTGSVPTVRITVDSNTVERRIQGTKEYLSSQGLDTALLGDLVNDSSQYQLLPIYEVTRFNLRTGQVENLGKFETNEILDDSAVPGGIVKGVYPLSFYENYRYVVKLGLRSPSALSTTQTSVAVDPNTGRSYVYNSYKYRSRRTSTDLPSVQEMSGGASRSVVEVNMDTIDVGVESSVRVNFEEVQPNISDLSVRRTFVKSNLLTWKVVGDPRLVDHYQIYAEADGVNALIGCSHPYTNDGNYMYEDVQMYDRVGRVTYNVVPVKLDFTRALGDAKVSVVKESTLLDFLRE